MDTVTILTYPASPGDPPAECQGKFLQLRLAGREYLVFAPTELHRFHNQILAHLLEDLEVPHRWEASEHLVWDHPEIAVIGGGKFRVSAAQRTLELWDNSQAYGRFDAEHLPEKIAAASHPWSGFTVRIA
jgi:hypothetical protein